MFSISILLTQVLIGRFWYYDDCDYDYADYDYDDDDDDDQNDYLDTFLFSSFSSHVTHFQEWSCEKCGTMFHFEGNYNSHKQICSSVDTYTCASVEMYTRARKAYEDIKENSMEMMYVISHFLCRRWTI